MQVDVKRYVMNAVSLDGSGIARQSFVRAAGYFSSACEHLVFEQLHKDSQGVSAVKILSVANQQGVPVYSIDSTNSSAILPRLSVSNETRLDIQNAIAAGKKVTIPERSIQYNDWHGDGYIIEDVQTGSAAYMISGGLAGGSTSQESNPLLDAIKYIFGEHFFDYAEAVLKFTKDAFKEVAKILGYIAAFIFAVIAGWDMYKRTDTIWKGIAAFIADLILSAIAIVYISAVIWAACTVGAAIMGILLVCMIIYLLRLIIMWAIYNAVLRFNRRYFARGSLSDAFFAT